MSASTIDEAGDGASDRTKCSRILALSGGGFLGLFTGSVLQALEARCGEPLGRRFDLLAGTSIGGVLALALAFEVPAARIVAVFEEYGQSVFSGRGVPSGPIGRLVDLSRAVSGPKYSGRALRVALREQFGHATLGDATHAVVIPAVDVARSHAKIFKSPPRERAERDRRLPVVDVAMAACAAPAYFPSVRIGSRLYADGGLFAVAPDQVAMHEAEHFDGVPPDRMRMLSIRHRGTALQAGEFRRPGVGGRRVAGRRTTDAHADERTTAACRGHDGRQAGRSIPARRCRLVAARRPGRRRGDARRPRTPAGAGGPSPGCRAGAPPRDIPRNAIVVPGGEPWRCRECLIVQRKRQCGLRNEAALRTRKDHMS